MESVNRKALLIAIILAALTSVLVYLYVSSAGAKPAAIPYINVYVAARTLPANYIITDNDIKISKIPKELLSSRAITDRSEIVGKRLMESIISGEEIIRDRLADESKAALSYRLPQGKRALSINVNEQLAISGLLRPGDFVDVIASFDREEEDRGSVKTVYPRITEALIQDVQVLALGQDLTVNEEKLKEFPKTVTLAVSAEDVEKLVYASEYGVLRLVLRADGDRKRVETGGIVRGDVTKGKGAYTASSTNGSSTSSNTSANTNPAR